MKEFNSARVQFTSIDPETEESYRVSLSDLKEDAEVELIKAVGDGLNAIVEGNIEGTTLTQTFDIN